MTDAHGRELRYLRVSVTDRCNMRCRYCMPPEGIKRLNHADVLTYEEIGAVARAAVGLGATSIRLTGGEPLVRRGITELVRLLHDASGVNDLSMTTNGALLGPAAESLKRAGLDRVNISVDSLDPDGYAAITRGGDLDRALAGMHAALAAGLQPVKINAVMVGADGDPANPSAGAESGDALHRWMAPFVDLARTLPVHVRFIELMPVGRAVRRSPLGAAATSIIEDFGGRPVDRPVVGAGPARYWRLDGCAGTLGLIAPVSEPFCYRCNRLRLTAAGELRPCLFGMPGVSAMPMLRPRVDMAALGQAIARAWLSKPAARRDFDLAGTEADASMCQIGG
jgi:cyclic pyranopterin phosphate synthase